MPEQPIYAIPAIIERLPGYSIGVLCQGCIFDDAPACSKPRDFLLRCSDQLDGKPIDRIYTTDPQAFFAICVGTIDSI